MIKVSELERFGIKLILGDKCVNKDLDNHALVVNDIHLSVIGRNEASPGLYVTEFAPRKNLGKQPVGDDVMLEIVNADDEKLTWQASHLVWEDCSCNVITWKPCIKWLMEQKIPTETPEEKGEFDGICTVYSGKELSAVKTLEQLNYEHLGGEFWKPPLGKKPDWLDEPTFTQADADAGKFPPVGSDCMATASRGLSVGLTEWTKGHIAYKTPSHTIFISASSEIEYVFCHLAGQDVKFKPIPTERDKAIDRIEKRLSDRASDMTFRAVAEMVYDAVKDIK